MSTSFGYHFNVADDNYDDYDDDDEHENEEKDDDDEDEDDEECSDLRKIRKLKEENYQLEVEFHSKEDGNQGSSSSSSSSSSSPTTPPLRCPPDDFEVDKIVSKYFFSASSNDLEGQEEEEHCTNNNTHGRVSIVTTFLWNIWHSIMIIRERRQQNQVYSTTSTTGPPPPRPPKIQPRFSLSSEESDETKSYNSNDSSYYLSSGKRTNENVYCSLRRVTLIFMVILSVSLLFLVILTVVNVPTTPDRNPASAVTPTVPSTNTTSSTSTNNTMKPYTYQLSDLLQQVTSQDVLLQQLQSPQHRAYRWMLDQQRGDDVIDLSNISSSDEELHRNLYLNVYQRYAMGTLYFALGGNDDTVASSPSEEDAAEPFFHIQSGWTNSTNWLSSNSVCTWNGVSCHYDQVIELSLPKNSLDGTIPSEIFILKHLQRIHLPHNSIKGQLPDSIESCTALMDIDISYNLMEEAIMDVLRQLPLPTIETLILDNNSFYGSIEPKTFVAFDALRILSISNNKITGTLPSDTTLTSSLLELNLDHNFFQGTLPSQWATSDQQQQLMVFNVGFNSNLTGSIPDSFYYLFTHLETLHLDFTSISGTIPTWIHELDALEVINMRHTRIEGTISKQLGLLSALHQLDLGDTLNLHGTVPNELCKLRRIGELETLVVNCGGQNPSIQCDCCSDCTSSTFT